MKASFIKSASTLSEAPAPSFPEVAFTGRSNAGKSSFINKLLGRKALVKVGKTPGKTRLLNFFSVEDSLIFTDLPGYGYAAVSKAMRKQFAAVIEAYLRNSKMLMLCFVLMDIRRSFQVEERYIMQLMAERGIYAQLVLTKADKLARGALLREKSRIAREIGTADLNILHFSSVTGDGYSDVWRLINEKTGSNLGSL
ncbi:MAG: ribosome biogenesis GTP-binding protein YihA/YsxC [Deferribacteraceae bacterium]|jgi:GTP-binding protein|nr:ribosome biogenesis GTP-binding protein YihA/YsxC [Deferribacteraceae bacterium]